MRGTEISRSALLGLILLCMSSVSMAALSPVTGPHLTITPQGGYVMWDDQVNLKDHYFYGGTIGLMFSRYVGLEGHFDLTNTETEHGTNVFTARWNTVPSYDADIQHYGGNVIVNILPNATIVPFLLGGWQEIKSEVTWPVPRTGAPGFTDFTETKYRNGVEVGAGLKFRISPRVAVRLEARDATWKFDAPPAPNDDLTHNLFYTGGIEFAIGGSTRLPDADRDGIPDKRDACPDTPAGARVDARGCPIDSDGDGVPDGLDQCPHTPKGAVVDAQGCPHDTDGDGVVDGIDQCPDTPKGVTVDARGCPTDSDGDGVPDGIDQCANTPKGAVVDARGCPMDSDGDGVPDGIDRCPNTPEGAKVDVNGCPIEVSEKETEMLSTGMITERNIRFNSGKWDILPGSFPVLDEIGQVLMQWPDLKVEIGGHTDSRGSDAANQELSEKRARAVLDYLVQKFPQINAGRLTAVGYGESRPVADNATEQGRALNRRVEFRVLNPEVLKREVERRRTLQKGE